MRCIACMLAVLAIVAASTQAQAAQFLYAISGTVFGEELTFDEYHIFDPQQGDAFVAKFLVDDASPLALYAAGPTGSSARGGGAIQLGTRTPVTSWLTIRGNTYGIRTGDLHSYSTIDPNTGDPIGPTDVIEESGLIDKDATAHRLTLSSSYFDSHSCCFPHPGDSYDAGESLDFNLGSGAFSDPEYRQTGTFSLDPGSSGYFGKSSSFAGNPGAFTQILLLATSLTVTQVSAVPETGAWLMMILGISAIGLVARARAGQRFEQSWGMAGLAAT